MRQVFKGVASAQKYGWAAVYWTCLAALGAHLLAVCVLATVSIVWFVLTERPNAETAWAFAPSGVIGLAFIALFCWGFLYESLCDWPNQRARRQPLRRWKAWVQENPLAPCLFHNRRAELITRQQWLEDHEDEHHCRVELTPVGPYRVWTIWLGITLATEQEPRLFETTVMLDDNVMCALCNATEIDARNTHERCVSWLQTLVRGKVDKPPDLR